MTATLSNNTGFLATAKYKVKALTVFGGYGWLKQANPSDDFLNGFQTIGGWNVPATIPSSVKLPSFIGRQAWTNFTNFNVPRIAPYFWLGAKYAITPQLDVTGAYYYLQQTDFNTTACTGITNTFTEPNGNKFRSQRVSSNKCAGTEDAFSALIDWRPVKRVDLYAGVMVSNVYGGLANGFQAPRTSPRLPACASSSDTRVLLASAAALLPPRLGSVLCRRPPAGVASSAAGEER